jgi:DeoR/GlpR family transcriptional regulator of sugar metabolism
VLLADHTKWGVVSLSSFARLNEVDVLVTDDRLPADARAEAADAFGEVVYAETMTTSHALRQTGLRGREAS